ncbi:hypothetical protein MMC11_007536 [Xylographa trunciseda]|nr:hypothetical protein [Xylographa trunciseda]
MPATKKRPVKDLTQSNDSSSKRSQKHRKTKLLSVTDDVPQFSHDPQESPVAAREPVAETANTTTSNSPAGLGNQSDVLPPSLRHLQSRYAFATMSINSSSKITQKVRSLRAHLEKFSFADLKAKPGVVALHAKANTASKMISIVEIVKREVEKEGGRLYQYSALASSLEALKEKKPRTENDGKSSAANGKTLAEWQAAQDARVEVSSQPAANDVEMDDDKVEEEESFETMTEKKANGQLKLQTSGERKIVRAIPMMTIYLSRVPISEFKQLYGEQAVA